MTLPLDPRLQDALVRLRSTVQVPAHDDARERVLLAAFDAADSPSAPRRPMVFALTLSGAVLALTMAARPMTPPDDSGRAGTTRTEFVEWPGADAYPTLESASVVRVQLPTDIVIALGLAEPSASTSTMSADLLIGQDGLTRAVRLAVRPDGSSPHD